DDPAARSELLDRGDEVRLLLLGGLLRAAPAAHALEALRLEAETVFLAELLADRARFRRRRRRAHVGGRVADPRDVALEQLDLGPELALDLLGFRVRVVEAGAGREVLALPRHRVEVAVLVGQAGRR